MAREQSFYFVPLRKKKGVVSGTYVRLQNNGIIHISKYNLERMVGNSSKPFIAAIFIDLEKRALAWQVREEVKLALPENYRLIKPYSYKNGGVFAQLNVKNFIKVLENVHAPQKLEVKEYKDPQYGKMFYVEIPVGKPKEEEPAVEN